MPGSAHVRVDMQRMFAEHTEWHTPWMTRVLPAVHRLAARDPARTIFTRFVPPAEPHEMHGHWRQYYDRWSSMTLSRLGAEMVELLPALKALTPPAQTVDKRVYSPWFDGALQRRLAAMDADLLVVSGGETDVCVLATVLGAVDHGYRVVVVADALCGSCDETHDSLRRLYETRFSQQVEVRPSDALDGIWPNS